MDRDTPDSLASASRLRPLAVRSSFSRLDRRVVISGLMFICGLSRLSWGRVYDCAADYPISQTRIRHVVRRWACRLSVCWPGLLTDLCLHRPNRQPRRRAGRYDPKCKICPIFDHSPRSLPCPGHLMPRRSIAAGFAGLLLSTRAALDAACSHRVRPRPGPRCRKGAAHSTVPKGGVKDSNGAVRAIRRDRGAAGPDMSLPGVTHRFALPAFRPDGPDPTGNQ